MVATELIPRLKQKLLSTGLLFIALVCLLLFTLMLDEFGALRIWPLTRYIQTIGMWLLPIATICIACGLSDRFAACLHAAAISTLILSLATSTRIPPSWASSSWLVATGPLDWLLYLVFGPLGHSSLLAIASPILIAEALRREVVAYGERPSERFRISEISWGACILLAHLAPHGLTPVQEGFLMTLLVSLFGLFVGYLAVVALELRSVVCRRGRKSRGYMKKPMELDVFPKSLRAGL